MAVISSTSKEVDFVANAKAIDDLVGPTKYAYVVAWGKWLGFTPETVQTHVKSAESENAPLDAIQKLDGVWTRFDEVVNETNRARVLEIAERGSF